MMPDDMRFVFAGVGRGRPFDDACLMFEVVRERDVVDSRQAKRPEVGPFGKRPPCGRERPRQSM